MILFPKLLCFFLNLAAILFLLLITLFNYFQAKMVLRYIKENCSNRRIYNFDKSNYNQNISSKISSNGISISDFQVLETHFGNTGQIGISYYSEEISIFLVFYKKMTRLIYMNLLVLLIIIISYFHFLISNFIGDIYNIINIIQDGDFNKNHNLSIYN